MKEPTLRVTNPIFKLHLVLPRGGQTCAFTEYIGLVLFANIGLRGASLCNCLATISRTVLLGARMNCVNISTCI